MDSTARATKNAEFARLFDLFEKLAARGARDNSGTTMEESGEDAFIPADLAPVLGNLATLVASRSSTRRKRRNTTVGIAEGEDMVSGDALSIAETMAKFPLVKRFPFTFKLMIHKLYDMDEWREKIESVLLVSQEQFKTLEEEELRQTKEAEGAEASSRGNAGLLGLGLPAGVRRGVRTRSQSVNVGHREASPVLRPQQPSDSSIRAVKKRCVGRRKSVSALMFLDNNVNKPASSAWVYDASVSCVGSNTFSTPTVESQWRMTTAMRARHRSLTKLEPRSPNHNWMSFGVIEEDWNGKEMGMSEAETTRRRALSVVESSRPKAMKRGLSA